MFLITQLESQTIIKVKTPEAIYSQEPEDGELLLTDKIVSDIFQKILDRSVERREYETTEQRIKREERAKNFSNIKSHL